MPDKFYAKVAGDQTYWFVRDGKRRKVGSPTEMYSFGLFKVVQMTEEELEAIPLFGSRRKRVEPDPVIEALEEESD